MQAQSSALQIAETPYLKLQPTCLVSDSPNPHESLTRQLLPQIQTSTISYYILLLCDSISVDDDDDDDDDMTARVYEGWAVKRHVYGNYLEDIPPALYQYMLDHPNQSYGPDLIAASAVCCSAALCAVILRLVSRLVVNVGFGKDDYTIVVALVRSI